MLFYLKTFRKNISIFIAAVLVLLIADSTASARRQFIIVPKIDAGWQRESNYYKTETDERAVETYTFQPGIEFGYETPKSIVLLDYILDIQKYKFKDSAGDWHHASDEDNFMGQSGTLRMRTKPFNRLTIGLDDSVLKTRDSAYLGPFATSDTPYLGPFSSTADKEEYFINRLTLSTLYGFGAKFAARVRYVNTITDYETDIFNDSTEHRGILNLMYNFTRRSSIDVEIQHWARDYDGDSSDYSSDQINLVLRKQIKHFTFEGELGYHKRTFDDDDSEDLGTTDYLTEMDDMTDVNYMAAVMWQNPPQPVVETRTNLAFMSPVPGTRVGGYDLYYPSSNPKTYMLTAVKQNINDDAGTGDNYFTALQFTAQAGHIFKEKFLVNLAFNYQKSDYETRYGLSDSGGMEPRNDDIYRYSAGVGYKFKDWLSCDLNAGVEKRDSNLSGYDYNNKFIMFKVNFSYDVGSTNLF